MWFRRHNKGKYESEEALQDARQNLKEVQKRGGEVKKVSDALKEIRQRNHFAEQMEDIIIRHRGSLR